MLRLLSLELKSIHATLFTVHSVWKSKAALRRLLSLSNTYNATLCSCNKYNKRPGPFVLSHTIPAVDKCQKRYCSKRSRLSRDLRDCDTAEEIFRLFKQFYKIVAPADIVTTLAGLHWIHREGTDRNIIKDERFDLIKQAIKEQMDDLTAPQVYLAFRFLYGLGDDCSSDLNQDLLIKVSETCTLLSIKRLIHCIYIFNQLHERHDTLVMNSLSIRFNRQLANRISWDPDGIEKLDDETMDKLAAISEPLRQKVNLQK